jgi:hypothetical protein
VPLFAIPPLVLLPPKTATGADVDTGAAGENAPGVVDTAGKRDRILYDDHARAGGDFAQTADLDTAGNHAAADQNAVFSCADRAAIDDRAVDGAVAEDADAVCGAGNEVGVEEPASEERAAGDDDTAAGPDRARVGDATAKDGSADLHGVGVTAELGRIRSSECHWWPPKGVAETGMTACRSRSPRLPQSSRLIEAYRPVRSSFP